MSKEKKEIVHESACGFVVENENSHIEVFGKDFAEVKKCLELMTKNKLVGAGDS